MASRLDLSWKIIRMTIRFQKTPSENVVVFLVDAHDVIRLVV